MKKMLSVILSVVMLLSCMVSMAVGANAAVTYPEGGNSMEVRYTNGTLFATHRIADLYSASQNCFRITGYVTYHNNDYATISNMDAFCLWAVRYTTGNYQPVGSYLVSATPDSGNRVKYEDSPRTWDASRTLIDITIQHELRNGEATVSLLSSKYTP